MAIRHLTDMEFQAYLDKGKKSDDIFIDAHLNECKKCRQELKIYQLLYNELKDDTAYNLNPGFSDAVMTRLIANQIEQPRFVFEKVLYLIGSIIALIVGGYFLDLNKIASAMTGPFVPIIDTLKNLTTSYIELLSVSGHGFAILCFSVLILIGVYFADNLLLNYKEKQFCL